MSEKPRTLHADVPTLTAHRSSFCHAELVSASVRGDVLEMARCEILKQVQDDICVLTSHCSPLTTHHSSLTSHNSSLTAHCSSPICQKTRKGDFWGEEEKCERFHPSYNQVDTNK